MQIICQHFYIGKLYIKIHIYNFPWKMQRSDRTKPVVQHGNIRSELGSSHLSGDAKGSRFTAIHVTYFFI